MKTKTKIFGMIGIVTVIALFSLYSCEKTDVAPAFSVKELLVKGTWTITSFNWHDKEPVQQRVLNNHFIGYTFQYDAAGVITATHNNNIVEYGKWRKVGDKHVYIDFGHLEPLNELNNENWEIVEHTDRLISFRGISPVDYSSEYLVIEK